MTEWIKLIWDFHGTHSEGTAEHHARHLGEFAQKEELDTQGHGHENVSDAHWFAYLIVSRENMIAVRDALRPNRATIHELT